MKKTERAKYLRNWRIKKVTMYLIGAALFVIGIIVFIQSFLSGSSTKEAWRFPFGFAIVIAGCLIFAEAWNETFKDYLRKKGIQ